MLPDIIRPLAGAITAGLFGLGSWVVAQASTLENPLELIGGGILDSAAVVSLALILRASRFERQSADTVVGRLEARIGHLEDDLSDERDRSARLLLAYDHERQLRLSLEEAGTHDRRRFGSIGRQLVTDRDFEDLDGELERHRKPGSGP